jgi:hypothetical protein
MHDKSGKQVIEYGIVPIDVMASMSGLDFVRANFKGSAVCACDDDLPCVRISEGERVDPVHPRRSYQKHFTRKPAIIASRGKRFPTSLQNCTGSSVAHRRLTQG